MPDPPKITLDTVAEAYVNTREEIRALEAEIEVRKSVQAKREAWLCAKLQSEGLQNSRTQHGTVYLALKESVTVGDWDALVGYAFVTPVVEAVEQVIDAALVSGEHTDHEALKTVVRQHLKLELINRACGKASVLDMMGEKRDAPPPPGVNYSAVRTAQVRKN